MASSKYNGLECPFCHEMPPVHQCVGGDSLCCKCRVKCNKCLSPSRSVLTENRFLRNVLPCKFAEFGCEDVHVRVEGLRRHEQVCWGGVVTRCESCDWVGRKSNLAAHVQTKHDDFVVGRRQGLRCIYKDVIMECNKTKLIRAFGELFWFRLRRSRDFTWNTFTMQRVVTDDGTRYPRYSYDLRITKAQDQQQVNFEGIEMFHLSDLPSDLRDPSPKRLHLPWDMLSMNIICPYTQFRVVIHETKSRVNP